MEKLILGIERELEESGLKLERLDELQKYSNLIPNLTNQRLDKWNGLQLANEILVGQIVAAEIYSIALRVKYLIYAERKKQGALAYLDRSVEYFEDNKIKSTEGAKSEYKEVDREHCFLKMKEASIEALVEYMRLKISAFEKAYYLCKSAYTQDASL